MLSYCLNCKKILRAKIQKFQKQAMVKQWFYQNVLYAAAKNQNLLKNNKQKGY